MSFTTPLFVQTDLVFYSGDVTKALQLTRTPIRIGSIAPLNSTAVYRPGADYVLTAAGVVPQRNGAIYGLPAGSLLLVTYQYAGVGPAKTYDYQIGHILSYGQSLSLGERATVAYPANLSIYSASQPFGSLMFSGGTRPLQTTSVPAVAYAALVPLVENSNNSNPGQCTAAYNIGTPGETPLSGLLDWINTEAALEGFHPGGFNFLGSCPGLGGTSITGLNKTTGPYNRLLNEVTLAKALAIAAGKTYGVPAVLWLQGEADSGDASYQAQLTQLFIDLNTDIKAITGQAKDVQFFMYQTNAASGPAALPAYAQYNVAAAAANVHIASPVYPFGRNTTDNTHLLAFGSRIIGSYFGRAIKRQVIDGVGFTALKPTTWAFSGGNIVLNTNSQAGLVLDSLSGVGSPTWGFSLTTAGLVPVAITSVAVTGVSQLTLTPASAASAGFILSYAAINGGGVRDNMGYLDRGGGVFANVLMHNWMAVFQQVL